MHKQWDSEECCIFAGTPGAQGGYINDDGDTGKIRLAITINKAQGQSLEKCGIDLNTDFFPMDNYLLHVQESVNLTIYLYAQTMGHQRMLYIRKFYVAKNIYVYIILYSQVGHRDTTTMARNDLRARGDAMRPHQLGSLRATPTSSIS